MKSMNRIKEIRKKKKLTLQQVSNKTGISVSSLSAYEKQEGNKGYRNPKIENWIKLANFFNVSVTYLMGISDQTLKLYRVSTSFDSYIVKAASEERAKELVWLDEVEAIPESWTDEYDVQEIDIKNMDVEGVISRGN